MKHTNYKELKSQLDEVVATLQDPEVDIDDAIKLHEKATKLILELESYLKDAELKIKKATKT